MLGVNLQNNLSWDQHLSSGKKALLPAVRRQLGMLSRISRNMSKRGHLQLINCLVMSKIAYVICIWGNSHENQIRKVQVVQNIAARQVSGLARHTRQSILLKECGWLDIKQVTKYHSLLQMWKTVGLPQIFK